VKSSGIKHSKPDTNTKRGWKKNVLRYRSKRYTTRLSKPLVAHMGKDKPMTISPKMDDSGPTWMIVAGVFACQADLMVGGIALIILGFIGVFTHGR